MRDNAVPEEALSESIAENVCAENMGHNITCLATPTGTSYTLCSQCGLYLSEIRGEARKAAATG